MKKIIIALYLITFIFSSNNSIPAGSFRWIKARGGLRMRYNPDLKGEKIGLIPYGTKVELLKETGEKIRLAGTTGRWSRVRWYDKTGWVFGGFLSNKDFTSRGKGEFFSALIKRLEVKKIPFNINNKILENIEKKEPINKKAIAVLGIERLLAKGDQYKNIPIARFKINRNIHTILLMQYYLEESYGWLINFSRSGEYIDGVNVYYDNSEGSSFTESEILSVNRINVDVHEMGRKKSKVIKIRRNGKFKE